MVTGVLAGLAAGALWGLVFVAPRMLGGYSSVDMAAGRFVVYGALSALIMLATLRTRRWPTRAQALAALGMSALGFTGYYLLLVFAIRDAGTELPSLIIGTIPIWVMLLGKPDDLRWPALLPGLALTAVGLGLMLWVQQEDGGAGGHPQLWRGVVLAVGGMVSWTVFALYNAAWLKRHPEVRAADWANWLGVATGAGALLLWLALGSDAEVLLQQEGHALAALIFIATGIGSAWLATLLWNMASQRLSASLCGQLIVSETLFALLYSFLWDGLWPSGLQWLACALFTLGIMASIRAHR